MLQFVQIRKHSRLPLRRQIPSAGIRLPSSTHPSGGQRRGGWVCSTPNFLVQLSTSSSSSILSRAPTGLEILQGPIPEGEKKRLHALNQKNFIRGRRRWMKRRRRRRRQKTPSFPPSVSQVGLLSHSPWQLGSFVGVDLI